jgi:type II secretory pathway component GspD/PulD (secretin)
MRRYLLTLISAASLALAGGLALAQSLEIIQLRNRPADQVLPVIRPLLAAGGSATGSGFQLFVRTAPDNLAQIRQVVASLDRAARQLVISVRQDAAGQGARNEANGARVLSSSGASRDSTGQQVRTQEGVAAYVAAGTSDPLVARSVTSAGGRTTVQESIVQRDINSGFYVTPRINGDTVFLDISTQRDTPADRGPGSANTSRTSSTVSGKLGEWIELGGTAQSGAVDNRGTVLSSSGASARSVYVKVEEAR